MVAPHEACGQSRYAETSRMRSADAGDVLPVVGEAAAAAGVA